MYRHNHIEYDSESEISIFQILCQDSKILKKFCLSFCSYYFCFLLSENETSRCVRDGEMYRKKEIMMDFSNFVPRFQNFEKILPIVFFLLLLLLFLIRNKTFKCVRDEISIAKRKM